VQRCKDAGDDKARRYRVGPWAIRTGWRPVRPTEQICRSGEGGARSPVPLVPLASGPFWPRSDVDTMMRDGFSGRNSS
jgi:hypothetical protein